MFRSNAKRLLLEKALAENRMIDQTELANATHLQLPTVRQWLSDEPFSQVKASTVRALCQYFNCTMAQLYFLVDDDATPESQTPLLHALVS